MDKKQLLALIATFDPTEKEAFAKSLGFTAPTGGGNTGLTQADLDLALEPFTKGGGGIAGVLPDTSALGDHAKLDVTGFLGDMKKSLDTHFGASHHATDVIAKGFAAFMTKLDAKLDAHFDKLEKSLTAPGGSTAITSASQMGNMSKGGAGAEGGRVIDPNLATKYEAISADKLLDVMRKGYESSSDPARKAKIMDVMVQYEAGADFDPGVIEELGLTF